MTSSPMPAARSQYLLDLLAQVPDPRKRRGRRQALAGLLAVGIAANDRDPAITAAIGQWAADAGDEAYALIREALTTSGDIYPGAGQLLIRLDPLTAPRRTQALAALCDQLNQAQACYPGTDLVLRYEVKSRPNPA